MSSNHGHRSHASSSSSSKRASTVSDGFASFRTDALRNLSDIMDERALYEQRYANIKSMPFDDLAQLAPPDAIYDIPDADTAADADAIADAVANGESILMPDSVRVEPDIKRRAQFKNEQLLVDALYRRMLIARYAAAVYNGLMQLWSQPLSLWPGRQRLLTLIRNIESFCVRNCSWLNKHTKTRETAGASGLLSMQYAHLRLLCVEHQFKGTTAHDAEQFQSSVGDVRLADSAVLVSLELIADGRTLADYSANDVYRFVHRMTMRFWNMTLVDSVDYDAATSLETVLGSLDVVERWMARMHIVTHAPTSAVFARCPLRCQRLWFTKVNVPEAAVAKAVAATGGGGGALPKIFRYALRSEFIADMTLMIYEMRRHLWLHRTLCFPSAQHPPLVTTALDDGGGGGGGGGGNQGQRQCELLAVVGADDIRTVANLPCDYDASVIDVMVRFVCSRRSDPRTFLEQAHSFMLQRSINIGEVERYQRSHNGHAARRPGDLLHNVRGPNPSAYLMNKSSDLSVGCVWDEEASAFARELFVHELLLNDHRSRLTTYDWKENVLYAPAISGAGLDATERFIVEQSVRRSQPFIVQSVGCFLLVHRQHCYRTVHFGEATAMWFWLVDERRMPSQLQRLVVAYRHLLWYKNATLMQNVDNTESQLAPPDDDFITITM